MQLNYKSFRQWSANITNTISTNVVTTESVNSGNEKIKYEINLYIHAMSLIII